MAASAPAATRPELPVEERPLPPVLRLRLIEVLGGHARVRVSLAPRVGLTFAHAGELVLSVQDLREIGAAGGFEVEALLEHDRAPGTAESAFVGRADRVTFPELFERHS